MTGGFAMRFSTGVLPGWRSGRPSWAVRLLLAVLAVVGFGILLTALSPGARADEGPGRSASAPGRAMDPDGPTAGDTWEEPPADPAPDAPPASEPDAPPADGGGEIGVVDVGVGVDVGGPDDGKGSGNGRPDDDASGHGNGGGQGPVELPAVPVVVDIEPLPLPPPPPPPLAPPVPAPVGTGTLAPTDAGTDVGSEQPTAVVADDDAVSTSSPATAVEEAPAEDAVVETTPVILGAPAPAPEPQAVSLTAPASRPDEQVCGDAPVTHSAVGASDSSAPSAASIASAAPSPPPAPAEAPQPVVPPVPAPPAAPAPFSAPVGPCGTGAVGPHSGGGTHDGAASPLAVLGDAATASLARESARAISSSAGHVVGGADDPGDRPD